MSDYADAIARAIRQQKDPDFDYMSHSFTPWAPIDVDLAQAKVALISTAGVYMKHGWHQPFDPEQPYGDPSWRETPAKVDPEDLAISHGQYDQQYAQADINVVYPLQRLHELAAYGYIGAVAPFAYSFSGFVTRPLSLVAEHAPNVAYRLKRAGANVALLVPGSALCHQTMGLIARTVELAGISTVCLGLVEAAPILAGVRPPRTVLVDHIVGAPLGAPGNAAKHQHLIREALEAAYDLAEPGGVTTLSRYRWKP